MYNRGIFYCGRPITGFDCIRMLDHLTILETHCKEINHLSNTKTDSAKQAIQQYSGLTINKSINYFGDEYDIKFNKMDSWSDIYNALDVSCLKQYDVLYVMGSSCFRSSGFHRNGYAKDKFPSAMGKRDISFISHAVHYVNLLALLKAHHLYDIPLHEYSYDTDELPMNLYHESLRPTKNYHLYYGHSIPQYGAQRLDCTQYYLSKQTKSFFDVPDKTIDFMGGYTNYNDTRNLYAEEMEQITKQVTNSKIFVKDKKLGIDTFLAPDTYNNMLESTRFTMVFPAYDRNVISIDRTIGALYRDCLPLFHSSCNLDIVEETFGVDLKHLQTTLVPSESSRLESLGYLQDKILKYRVGFS